MNVILLGAPGAGKGTLAEKLVSKDGFTAISTGSIFRQAIKEQTTLGQKVKILVEEGSLVPDELTIALVQERLGQEDWGRGFILDGFPRTLIQAHAFYDWCSLPSKPSVQLVINLEIDRQLLEERLTGRWVCRACGASYHERFNPSQKKGICSHCQGELFQREDDKLESVKKRLVVYEEQTAPLISFYEKKGLLRCVNAQESPQKVYEATKSILEV